ncbi:sulfotransferase family protein [Pseudofrankia asymbiotica]|uniref:Sulfotransferase family protein n=1 Tax=Pseudofrankia asymbiotica TaxID=1834516 RepID=A0A1V2I4Z6_9ACTN|nr:sulfotransferase family protein [Pseudofrankia asymbiotica]ONH26098.1 sulfotransferase family protein [Pseudofrankia asymbiotica]
MVDIVGAGFGRTGTLSLKGALEQLGFGPCHHGFELMKRRETVFDWLDVVEGKPADWDSLFAGYRSTVDWPGARFWRELAAHDPESKVVLSVRDPEKWYESVKNTLYQAILNVPEQLPDEVKPLIRLLNLLIWDGVFDGRFADKDHALRVYEDHIAEVKREIPADRLLVFDVAEGWEPLCAFLGVPVPAEPFPRLNERDAYTAQQQARVATATVTAVTAA